MGWCRICGTRRTEDGICALCATRAARSVCTVCGEPGRGGSLRCPAHTSAPPVTDAGPVDGSVDDGSSGEEERPAAPRHRTLRDLALVVAAIVAFNLAFPWLIGSQRPTVSAATTGAVGAARVAAGTGAGGGAGAGVRPGPAPPSQPLTMWDPVDVDLFIRACTQGTPAEVCQCESSGLQRYYTGEQALAYAGKQNTRAPLPPRYRDVLVGCSDRS